MAIKLTLEVKVDEEIGGPPDAMASVIRKLNQLVELPVNGVKLVFVVADELGAERVEDELDALLADRPYRIVATIDRKYDKRDLERRRLEPGPSPIDREIERVELSSRGRTVELTAQSRRNAETFLRNAGMGADDDTEVYGD